VKEEQHQNLAVLDQLRRTLEEQVIAVTLLLGIVVTERGRQALLKDEHHRAELASLRADFERQLESSQEDHREEIARLQRLHSEKTREMQQQRQDVEAEVRQYKSKLSESQRALEMKDVRIVGQHVPPRE
jgi:Skp family chaperone for outer membrane proteins